MVEYFVLLMPDSVDGVSTMVEHFSEATFGKLRHCVVRMDVIVGNVIVFLVVAVHNSVRSSCTSLYSKTRSHLYCHSVKGTMYLCIPGSAYSGYRHLLPEGFGTSIV